MNEKSDAAMCVDEIEASVYAQLKPLGFRKHGRTLHRFVSGDLSQIIHFQCGLPSAGPAQQMWVNLGIRIPECDERTFSPSPLKRYYHEYNCTLRSRLGSIDGRQALCFDLREQTSQLLKQILPDVLTKVLPVYDVLSSREAILAHRRDYPHFDVMGRQLILLDEAMICGHLGDLEKAQALFAQYYVNAVHAYQHEKARGKQIYLQKGERVICHGQNITADKTGYFTVRSADDSHIRYLAGLAEKLGLSLPDIAP